MSSLNDAKKLAKYNYELNSKSTAQALKDAKTLANYNNTLEQNNTKLQFDYNKALAQEDRSWQERMANSAHQREIADLKAAGLNPVLSVTGGNGAATPGGSATSVSKPSVDMSLPKAVMDMAMAQLNSATSLQIAATNANAQLQSTAMNNTTSLQTTAMNNATQRYTHDSPGANSLIGLGEYLYGDEFKGIGKDVVKAVSGKNNKSKFGIVNSYNSARNSYMTKYKNAADIAMTKYLELSMKQASTKVGTKAYRKNKRKLKRLEKRISRYDRNIK